MRAAVRTLARGWRRGAKRWYIGTTLVLGLSITLLLVVSGLFAGMQQETQERVSDFYTQDVRVTSTGLLAVPPRTFTDMNATAQALSAHGTVSLHYESQAVLSRRSLEDTIAREDDQVQVDVGGTGDGDEIVAMGVLIGIDAMSPSRDDLRKHIAVGTLPGRGTGEGSIPLVMSLDRFSGFLTASERTQMSWPPSMAEVREFSFQVTAAKLVTEGETRDMLRRPAHIVGLYDSGVDVMDSFTFLAPIEDVRQLNDHPIHAPQANVALVQARDADAVHATAARHGWVSQDAADFTDRYLGQLIDVLQVLSTLVSVFLFMLPAFLIMHGVGRQLETHNREIAVCHAIGVRPRTIRQALGQVVAQVTLAAVALAAFLTTVLGLTLHIVLPPRRDLPLPMDFQATGASIALAVGVTVLSVLAALWIAFRSQAKQPLASTLRTF